MGAGLSAPSRAKVHDRTPAGHCQVKRVTSAVPGLHPQTNCPFGLGADRGLARRALQLPSSSFLASAFRLPDRESSPRTRNLSLQLCASFLPGGPRSPGLQPLQSTRRAIVSSPCGLASLLLPPWGREPRSTGARSAGGRFCVDLLPGSCPHWPPRSPQPGSEWGG